MRAVSLRGPVAVALPATPPTEPAPVAPKKIGRGRDTFTVALARPMQLAAARRAPYSPHAEHNIDEVTPAVRAALEASGARAFLATLDASAAMIAVLSCVAAAVRCPVRWRAGCNDFNSDNHDAQGNGWGRFIAAVEDLDAPVSGQTARRRWKAAVDAGQGVRVEQNDQGPRCTSGPRKAQGKGRARPKKAAPWKSPTKGRKSGELFPSAATLYKAKRIRSLAYVAAAELRRVLTTPELAPLIRELAARLPLSFRKACGYARSKTRTYTGAIRLSRAQVNAAKAYRKIEVAGIQAAKEKRARTARDPLVISKEPSFRGSKDSKEAPEGPPPLPPVGRPVTPANHGGPSPATRASTWLSEGKSTSRAARGELPWTKYLPQPDSSLNSKGPENAD